MVPLERVLSGKASIRILRTERTWSGLATEQLLADLLQGSIGCFQGGEAVLGRGGLMAVAASGRAAAGTQLEHAGKVAGVPVMLHPMLEGVMLEIEVGHLLGNKFALGLVW